MKKNDIERVIERVTKNNIKAMRKIPQKNKQICETCARAGIDCARRAGRCCNGLWRAKI